MTDSLGSTAALSELGDFPPEWFRAYGHQIVDWIAEYLENVEHYPVMSQVQPGSIAAGLPRQAPRQGEPFDQVLQDFERIILPGVTHWNHPGFLAYFAVTGSAPGILGEMLTAALNTNGMLWRTSPSSTELEETTLDWLRQMIGLPKQFSGLIYDTASISSMVAIAAAREAVGLGIREHGMSGRAELPRLRLYCSREAHSSIEKGAVTLGIGQENVRKIGVDDEFRLDPIELRNAIEQDRSAGHRPFCVVATAGTTSTTSVDPVVAIADICEANGLWLHVDAAYGGVAAILPEQRWVLAGAERADSLVINPHKWLFTPIDISALYTRRAETVRAAFSLVPEYLRSGEDGIARNHMDYGPQLGRRFRSLKLWFVLRSFGIEGIQARLREHIRLAQEFAAWVDAAPDWERLAPTPLSAVCFRSHPADVAEAGLDQLNQNILNAINMGGEALLSHTRTKDKLALRLAIGNIRTEERHIRRTWELLNEHARSFQQ
jgi:aromatic-L-amino-acid/L-tryptophan decarboxylase